MKNLILNYFLLLLRISLNLSSYAGHKSGRFFKTLSKKDLEFVSSRRDGIVAFNLGLVLSPMNLILSKRNEAAKGTH